MITQDKLREFIWAGGDIDGYARSGRRSDITDVDWFLIDRMLSAITIIRRGLAADTFRKQHEDQVREAFDSMETYQMMQEYETRSNPDSSANGSQPIRSDSNSTPPAAGTRR